METPKFGQDFEESTKAALKKVWPKISFEQKNGQIVGHVFLEQVGLTVKCVIRNHGLYIEVYADERLMCSASAPLMEQPSIQEEAEGMELQQGVVEDILNIFGALGHKSEIQIQRR